MSNTYLLGIDFGTYYTKVAYLESNGKNSPKRLTPRLLNIRGITDSEGFIPTFICEDSIGAIALSKCKSEKSKELKRGFKTEIHTEEGRTLILKFLTILKQKITEQLKDITFHCKFSLPAGWKKVGEKAELFKELIIEAGFILNDSYEEEKIFLSEPYAAAAYYLRTGTPVGNYLVIDAGAGTIDCAIVSITERNGGIKLEEIENTLDSFEKAGNYVDSLIDEEYKIGDPFVAEDIKIRASRCFSEGKDTFEIAKPPVKIIKGELQESLKSWLDEVKNFLVQYNGKFDRGNILLTGGLGNLYFLRELVQEIFDVKTILPKRPSKEETTHLQYAVSYGCVLELAGFIETVELVNYSVKIPIYYPLADKIQEVLYRGKPLRFETDSSRYIIIEVISPNEQTGVCSKKLGEITLLSSGKETRLTLEILGSFIIIAEDKEQRRETDSIELDEFAELEPEDYELVVDRDHIPKLRVHGKYTKTFEFRKLSKEFIGKR